ncbi:GNAT family N-acetyltransferase [Clostridiaceae bacterium OttesenSCG-928-D20]|nr:GNAT family N-acetyltransferase [Clostridiaceae bacterium OttesenSCG-928-D20]
MSPEIKIKRESISAEEYIDFLKGSDLGSQYPKERFEERISMLVDNVSIRRYSADYEHRLFSLIEHEGEEWKDYWYGSGRGKYIKALNSSITYLLFENEVLCGYARCRDDDGYGVYVYDLLVDKSYRGKDYGRMLMEQVCEDFPDAAVYVMSDVNPYYEKLGYEVEGTIFIVKKSRR